MISGSGVNSSVAMAGSMATSSITDSLWQVEGGVVVGAGGLRERGGGVLMSNGIGQEFKISRRGCV